MFEAKSGGARCGYYSEISEIKLRWIVSRYEQADLVAGYAAVYSDEYN